jgi:hypothetical protein
MSQNSQEEVDIDQSLDSHLPSLKISVIPCSTGYFVLLDIPSGSGLYLSIQLVHSLFLGVMMD